MSLPNSFRHPKQVIHQYQIEDFEDYVESLDSGSARDYARGLWDFMTYKTKQQPSPVCLSDYGRFAVNNNVMLILGK